MRRYFILSAFTILMFTAGCNNEHHDMVEVVYNRMTGEQMSSSDIFSSVEVLEFKGDEELMFGGFRPQLKIHNDKIYLFDRYGTYKLYIFNMDGEHLNTVGNIGRGPEEYIAPICFWVDDNDKISIYSPSLKRVFLYNPDGTFLEAQDRPVVASQIYDRNGYIYYFIDHNRDSGMPYRLQISNEKGDSLTSYLPSGDMMTFATGSFFSNYGDRIYLNEPYGDDIFLLNRERLDTLYSFNFGEYTFPKEFYDFSSQESWDYLEENTILIKNMFFEDDRNTIFSASMVTISDSKEDMLYGIKTSDGEWNWFLLPDGDPLGNSSMNYLYDGYVYFLADPVSLMEAFPNINIKGLDNLDDYDGTIIIKYKLR